MAVDSGLTLAAGTLTDARETYLNIRRESDPKVGLIVDLGKTSDKRTETRAHYRPAGHVGYRPYGAPMTRQGFDAESWDTPNYEFVGSVEWLRADREDDQTGSLREQSDNMGKSLAMAPEDMLIDAVNGTTSLLPATFTMPDGLDPFTSSTRHEDTGGNILSGQTLTTVAGWETAIYGSEDKFASYKDDHGKPLLRSDVLDGPTLIMYSSKNNKAARAAFKADFVQGSSAAPSNVLMVNVAGRQYILWETSRLATGVAVVSKVNGPKPFYLQTRTQILETIRTAENSDYTKDTGYETAQWEQRLGFGGWNTAGAIKLTA